MATTNRKGGKKTKPKTQSSPPTASYSVLKKGFDAQARELREALQRETATSEILRIIASSPTDIQPVLNAVAESAARLCEANNAVIYRVDGDVINPVAVHGAMPPAPKGTAINRRTAVGRAIVDRKTLHVHDLLAEVDTEYPESKEIQKITGTRTSLSTPLLREGISIGAIHVRRNEVRPFSDRQIKLLETFADQAVIAIENVRLFQELGDKTTELESSNSELREALEQQTVTSEILRVIASSPTDLQPVLEAVAESAARLCESVDAQIYRVEGDVMRKVVKYGTVPDLIPIGETRRISRGSNTGRAIVDRQAIHIHDMLAEREEDFPDVWPAVQHERIRTALAIPLLREGVPVGAIMIRRTEVRPFSDNQIALLKTFADQAVIAIENVRLFKELEDRNRDLTEALEQQTATSDVLRVISSSPTDVQPVFDAIVKSATRLCDASFGTAHRFDDQLITLDAQQGMTPEQLELRQERFPLPATRGTAVGRAIMDRCVVQIEDVSADPEYVILGHQREFSYRTVLAVPLLKDGNPIGALGMWRREVRPFTENQINLVKTFAEQAVIAIENVRLFQELKESLEQQTATSEILGVIASSPTDVQPVLDVVAENAARLCEATNAQVFRFDGNVFGS